MTKRAPKENRLASTWRSTWTRTCSTLAKAAVVGRSRDARRQRIACARFVLILSCIIYLMGYLFLQTRIDQLPGFFSADAFVLSLLFILISVVSKENS